LFFVVAKFDMAPMEADTWVSG